MNVNTLFLSMIILASSYSVHATEYIYRDLMANTLPSAKCESLDKAQQTAQKKYKVKRYAKRFCQTQGYGWGLDGIKDTGQLSCNSCQESSALQSCYLKDVIVTCRRIKPGTVGMLPGKG